MKKIISLFGVAMMASSIFAAPTTARQMQVENTNLQVREQIAKDHERISFDASQKAVKSYTLKTVSAEQKSQALKNEAAKIKNPRKAVQADGPVASYFKPDGTFFTGIDNVLGTRLFEVYPSVVGSWLNGVETWVWPNYSKNATAVDYTTCYTKYGLQERGWSIDADGNFVDTLAAGKANLDYLYSWHMPLQNASNTEGKNMFRLIGKKTSRPDTTKLADVMTVGGILAPYEDFEIGEDGMWPLTNAIFSTPKYGNGRGFIYDLDSIDEKKYDFSYIFGSTAVVVPGLDTTSLDPVIVDTIYDTIQPAMLYTYYEKPMSPLYIKDISIALVALQSDLKYTDPIFDSLLVVVVDKNNKPIISSIATINDTASMLSYPGKMVTFKLQKKDAYGTITEGIVVNDEFKVIVNGLNRPGNKFGIWAARNPYTGGQTLVVDNEGKAHHYAPYDPFIMLNGVMYTFEHAAHNPEMFNMPNEYTSDTINMVVEYDPESSEYFAYHADGTFKDHIPMVCATELLYDTISYAYNFNIQAPDWAQVDMTGYDRIIQEGYDYTYWSYFGAYNLYIWGDGSDTDVDQPEVGDEIKLSRYGRQLIFKVVETRNMPQGIENVSFQNNNKLYNVLGQEVGEDYKGVVIRNGKKFLK